mmetsp:Transcript_107585/g.314572  ORF Transcript_107585/g.314572 Transcript_107585/m.314572 type:complete len:246 (-) Transcript_107585:105-842(-)
MLLDLACGEAGSGAPAKASTTSAAWCGLCEAAPSLSLCTPSAPDKERPAAVVQGDDGGSFSRQGIRDRCAGSPKQNWESSMQAPKVLALPRSRTAFFRDLPLEEVMLCDRFLPMELFSSPGLLPCSSRSTMLSSTFVEMLLTATGSALLGRCTETSSEPTSLKSPSTSVAACCPQVWQAMMLPCSPPTCAPRLLDLTRMPSALLARTMPVASLRRLTSRAPPALGYALMESLWGRSSRSSPGSCP